MLFLLVVLLIVGGLIAPVAAQSADELPKCNTRAGWVWEPRVDPIFFCYEVLVSTDEAGVMPYTGLAFAPDGTLYAARPQQGQVLRITDTDGDNLPDSETVLDYAFEMPNALAFYDSSLYIAGGRTLYRLDHQTQAVTTLANDLPVAPGSWISGLIATDDGLYIGVPAACDLCEQGPQHGTVLRMHLDGSQREVVAHGLRYPAALVQHNKRILVSDSLLPNPADQQWPHTMQDELNAFDPTGPAPDFGWPRCITADEDDTGNCADVQAPLLRFQTGSTPIALVDYGTDAPAFPHLQGRVLLLLAGAAGRADIRGFEALSIELAAEPPILQTLIPFDEVTAPSPPMPYNGLGYANASAAFLNQRAVGVYPHHFYGAALSPQGWPTFSIGGGSIAMLRPGDWSCVWVGGVRACDNLHE